MLRLCVCCCLFWFFFAVSPCGRTRVTSVCLLLFVLGFFCRPLPVSNTCYVCVFVVVCFGVFLPSLPVSNTCYVCVFVMLSLTDVLSTQSFTLPPALWKSGIRGVVNSSPSAPSARHSRSRSTPPSALSLSLSLSLSDSRHRGRARLKPH